MYLSSFAGLSSYPAGDRRVGKNVTGDGLDISISSRSGARVVATATSIAMPAIDAEPLSELMTWDQIRGRYRDQWVALVEMDWDNEADTFTVARVAGHGPTRRAPFDQMRAAGRCYETVGHFFTGRAVPRGVEFIGLLVAE